MACEPLGHPPPNQFGLIHPGPISLPVAILDGLLLLALLGDVMVRYTRYLRDEEWAGGFLEWLVPGRQAVIIRQDSFHERITA